MNKARTIKKKNNMWPFKKKKSLNEVKLDEIIAKIKPDLKDGGFAIIGISYSDDKGQENMAIAAMLNKTSKAKVAFSTIKALQMGPTELLLAMADWNKSTVSYESPYVSELRKEKE